MENLHRDPNPGRRDYNAFISELVQFHKNRGTPFRHVPRVNGREVDLYALYNQVTALGGWQKVNDQQKWDVVCERLGIWSGCVNSSLALRQIYVRYLGLYEKLHFLGEDIDDDSDQNPDSRSRKQQFCTQQMLPLSYNHVQHEVTDMQRTGAGLSRTFVTASDYDKLCLSLLSALPNEQELVFNVCTILSNEGKHVLHLERTPRLLDLLLAQTGVWPENDPSLRKMYLESWESLEGRDVERFWRETLDANDMDIMELWGQENGCRTSLNEDDLFNLGQELGVRNAEGQSIMRVALILHNLSFEEHNVPVLVSNSSCLRFLILCAHCKWANLRQVALVTLSNLASQLPLHPERDLNSRLVLRMVTEGVASLDRFLVIRSLEILAQLCQHESNEDVIMRGLDAKFYHRLIELLTVHDIMMLIYTLEALYSLSDLGRSICEKIAKANKSIATLISLLTLDPDSLGPEARTGFKVVESFDSVTHAQGTTAAVHVSGLGPEVDSETYACNWLRSTYEFVQGHSIARNDIYADYVTSCSKMGRKGVVNANIFANCVKTVFPQTAIKKVENSTGVISYHHDGLRRKPAPLPMAPPSSPSAPKAVPGSLHTQQGGMAATSGLGPPRTSSPLPNPSHPNHSPILKAQLSAPPRPMPPPPAPHTPIHQTMSSSPSISPSPPPSPQLNSGRATPPGAGSGSSTLIKTLLASKVTKNIQRQQQLHENIPHSQSTTPTRISNSSFRPSVVKSIGVLGNIKQHTTPPSKFAAQIQNAVKSKPKVGGTFPPILPRPNRIIKDNPTPPPQASKTPKAAKSRPVPCGLNARLNGIQRDMQVDAKKACTQVNEPKNSVTQATQNNSNNPSVRLTNHAGDEGILMDVDEPNGHTTATPVSLDSMPRSDGEQSTSSRDTGFSSESDQNPSPQSQKDVPTKSPVTGQLVGVIRAAPKSQVSTPPVVSKQAAVVSNQPSPPSTTNSVIPRPSSPSQVLKSVLSDLKDAAGEEPRNRWLDKEKVYKSSPLLNGLLDKGRIPLLSDKQDVQDSLKNGNTKGVCDSLATDTTKETSAVMNPSGNVQSAGVNTKSDGATDSVTNQPGIPQATTLTNGQSSPQVVVGQQDAPLPALQTTLRQNPVQTTALQNTLKTVNPSSASVTSPPPIVTQSLVQQNSSTATVLPNVLQAGSSDVSAGQGSQTVFSQNNSVVAVQQRCVSSTPQTSTVQTNVRQGTVVSTVQLQNTVRQPSPQNPVQNLPVQPVVAQNSLQTTAVQGTIQTTVPVSGSHSVGAAQVVVQHSPQTVAPSIHHSGSQSPVMVPHSAPQTMVQHNSPPTAAQPHSLQTVVHHSFTQTTAQHTSSQTSQNSVSQMIVQQHGTNQTVVQHSAPQIVVQHSSPQMATQISAPQPTTQVSASQTMVHIASPQPMVQITAPQTIAQMGAPQMTVQHSTPQVVVQHSSPQTTAVAFTTAAQATAQINAPHTTVQHGVLQTAVQYSAPQTTVQHSSPQTIVLQGALQTTAGQSLVPHSASLTTIQQGILQAAVQYSNAQSTAQQNVVDQGASQSTVQQSPQQSVTEQGGQQNVVQHNVAQSTVQHITPQNIVRQSSPQNIVQHNAAQTLVRQAVPQTIIRHSAPQNSAVQQNVSQVTAPQATVQQGVLQTTVQQVIQQAVVQQAIPQTSVHQGTLQTIIQQGAPQTSVQSSTPVSTPQATIHYTTSQNAIQQSVLQAAIQQRVLQTAANQQGTLQVAINQHGVLQSTNQQNVQQIISKQAVLQVTNQQNSQAVNQANVMQTVANQQTVVQATAQQSTSQAGSQQGVPQAIVQASRTDAPSTSGLQPSLPKSDILLEAMRKSDLLLEMEQESSNQNSDLSSISDIARTVETASKTISRTNAECHSQVPFVNANTTIQAGTPCTIVRIISQPAAGQLPTASIIQPQVPQQNVRLMYISTPINTDDSGELIGFPRVSISQLNQIRQHVEQTNTRFATPKRPSTAVSPATQTVEAKRLRIESKTPLLEASLRSPVIVPTPVQSSSTSPVPQQQQQQQQQQPQQQQQLSTSSTSSTEDTPTRPTVSTSLPTSSRSEQTPTTTVTKTTCVVTSVTERTPTTGESRVVLANNRLTQASTSTANTTVVSGKPVESQLSSAPANIVPEKPSLEYVCEWKDCLRSFKTPMAVFVHASAVHAPEGATDMLCQWDNCDGMKRKRLSLLTHLQDRHCNDQILQLQALRKNQLSQFGKTSIPPPQPPPPHPGYAPDAALLAIRRHAIPFLSPKELAEKEGPISKSIHLTTSLIIRNLATYSPLARRCLRRYEPELVCLAMSNVESSRTLAQCLAEMSVPAD